MAPRFNPIIAKKGKTRQVLKRPAYLKPKKKANWQRVPYVRDPEAVKQVRGDRDSWKRSLPELLTCSPRALVELLRKDGLLPRLEGSVCPRCQHGTLGKLAPQRQGGPPKHRCNAKNCQAYISPHYAHPLFVDHWGKSHTPLSTQAALLLLLLNRVPHAAIHRLMCITKPLKTCRRGCIHYVKLTSWKRRRRFALDEDMNGQMWKLTKPRLPKRLFKGKSNGSSGVA